MRWRSDWWVAVWLSCWRTFDGHIGDSSSCRHVMQIQNQEDYWGKHWRRFPGLSSTSILLPRCLVCRILMLPPVHFSCFYLLHRPNGSGADSHGLSHCHHWDLWSWRNEWTVFTVRFLGRAVVFFLFRHRGRCSGYKNWHISHLGRINGIFSH